MANDIRVGGDASGNVIIQGTNNRARVVIIQQRVAEPVEAKPEPQRGVLPNPYRSLLAFTETDADFYFGRESQTADLYERFKGLQQPSAVRLLPVLGPSGSGKSSLARAGLIPELVRQPLPALLTPRVAVLTPGGHPLEALAIVLARVATNDLTPVAKTREFAEELARVAPDGSHDGLRRIADVLPSIESQRLVVLVDQFEETFSQAPARGADGEPLAVQDNPEHRAFIGNLLTAAADPSGRVTVVLTFRSDFLGAIQAFPELSRLVSAQGYIVPAMTREDLARAIAEPARRAGRPLEPETVELLVDQTVGREGALPLLQFALTRVWEARERDGKEPSDTLRELGGVGGALASFAHELYTDLPKKEQRIARRALLKMVQLGEGAADTRRRASLAEMVAQGETPDDVLAVLRRFATFDRRLVTLEGDRAEVTHEALITQWQDLRGWLDTSRADERYHRQFAEDVDEWHGSGRPKGSLYQPPRLDSLRAFVGRRRSEMRDIELQFYNTSENAWKARRRLRTGAIAAVVALALFMAGGGIWVARQQQAAAERQEQLTADARAEKKRADEARDDAKRQAQAATIAQQQADQRAREAEMERELAGLAERKALERESRLLAAQAEALFRDGRIAEGLSLAIQALPNPDGIPDRPYVAAAEAALNRGILISRESRVFRAGSDPIREVALNPSGTRLLTLSDWGEVRLWDVKDGAHLKLIAEKSNSSAAIATFMTFNPTGTHFVLGLSDHTARLLSADGSHELRLIGHRGPVTHAAFSPDGTDIPQVACRMRARSPDLGR